MLFDFGQVGEDSLPGGVRGRGRILGAWGGGWREVPQGGCPRGGGGGGKRARDVRLGGGARQPVRVSDLFGQPVVLAFFPGAFTGVCTREMCTFRDSLNVFTDAGARGGGISGDTPYAQKAWAG